MPEEQSGLPLMVERLTVATDQTYLLVKAPLRRQHGLCVEFREQEIQSGQLRHAGLRRVHRFQHSPADILWVRIFSVGDEFERQAREGRRARASRPRPHNQPHDQPHEQESAHYAYEDEDQSAVWSGPQKARTPAASYSGKSYNSIENIADFFASRGKKFSVPKLPVEQPKGKKGFRPGQKVRHPKYGEGTVYQREGEGEDAKITVQFPRFGLKKLVEKYAQLERVSS
jgi:hypothetical protein